MEKEIEMIIEQAMYTMDEKISTKKAESPEYVDRNGYKSFEYIYFVKLCGCVIAVCYIISCLFPDRNLVYCFCFVLLRIKSRVLAPVFNDTLIEML